MKLRQQKTPNLTNEKKKRSSFGIFWGGRLQIENMPKRIEG